MASSAKLVELDLSDNAFGPIGVEGIADLLRSASCFGLQELKLNNNGLGPNGGKVRSESAWIWNLNIVSVFVLKRKHIWH